MAISLTVNGVTYEYPSPGENPRWGENSTGWAVEVTNLLNTLAGAGDIIETAFDLSNNQTTFSDITGLFFNPSTIRAATIEYAVHRSTDSAHAVESGTMLVVYDTDNTATEKWKVAQTVNGDAGIEFSVGDSGQFQYKTSNMAGTGHDGIISFKARSLKQA